jgi:hypothetical protein
METLHGVAPTDFSRRQIDRAGDPIANSPRLAGCGMSSFRVAGFASSMPLSSAPSVLPAMMGLFGIVS